MKNKLNLKNQMIISCQAVDDEPLNDAYVMQKMALACAMAGTKWLRLSQTDHIKAIKEVLNLPIIGLIKNHYDDSDVIITATKKEIDQLLNLNVEIIAMDATSRKRPDSNLEELVNYIREIKPNQLIMADCASKEDVANAAKLHFNYIGTTLRGYTKNTKNNSNIYNNYEFIRWCVLNSEGIPIIAEGGIETPQQVCDIMRLGVEAVVVGSAITRPQVIGKKFYDKLKREGLNDR